RQQCKQESAAIVAGNAGLMAGEESYMSELRGYQVRDIERIESSLARCGKVLYVLPTGGGKTVITAGLIDQAVARDERVLILSHRREIINQTSRALAALDHGVI